MVTSIYNRKKEKPTFLVGIIQYNGNLSTFVQFFNIHLNGTLFDSEGDDWGKLQIDAQLIRTHYNEVTRQGYILPVDSIGESPRAALEGESYITEKEGINNG